MTRIKHYLETFNVKLIRGGIINNPKFVPCRRMYQPPWVSNEEFGNLKIKDNTKLTNKQKDTLNFDISKQISR